MARTSRRVGSAPRAWTRTHGKDFATGGLGVAGPGRGRNSAWTGARLRGGIGRGERLGSHLQGAEMIFGERLERRPAETREEAGQAIGRSKDARMDHPTAARKRLQPPVPVEPETLAHHREAECP